MPVYEYEPLDRDCLMCEGRIDVIQGIKEDALTHCPACGLEVKRIVSRATFAIDKKFSAGKAGQRGFTTFKRVGEGKWEKVDGAGPDAMVGSDEDIAQVKAEKEAAKPGKKLDLDNPAT